MGEIHPRGLHRVCLKARQKVPQATHVSATGAMQRIITRMLPLPRLPDTYGAVAPFIQENDPPRLVESATVKCLQNAHIGSVACTRNAHDFYPLAGPARCTGADVVT